MTYSEDNFELNLTLFYVLNDFWTCLIIYLDIYQWFDLLIVVIFVILMNIAWMQVSIIAIMNVGHFLAHIDRKIHIQHYQRAQTLSIITNY